MRTLFALTLASLLLLPSAQAQVAFGLKAGLNTASISFDEDTEDAFEVLGLDRQARLGFVGGAFLELPVGSSSFVVRPEVLYAQKGVRFVPEDDEDEGDLTVRTDYVEVPVLGLYRIPLTQTGLELGILAGPYGAFKVSESTRTEFDLGGETEGEVEETDNLISTDIGAAVGATIGAGAFAVDLRYGMSLINNADEESPDTPPGTEARHRVFSVTAAYTFGR